MSVGRTRTATTGIDPGRVAQFIVTLPDGTTRRGSGYLIGTTAVLTAAHVIDSAESVLVRFAPDQSGEWTAKVTSHWVHPGSDLAVVTIATTMQGPAVEPALFAGMPFADAVVELRSVGFPLWKLRTDVAGDATYRDSHHAVGKGALLSNSREGTLEFTVTPPGDRSSADASPWEGMSGAAVWHGDAIVGVVSEHHRSDGPGRLAVARLDRGIFELTAAERSTLGQVAPTLGRDEYLPSAGGVRGREQVGTAYHELVQDLAPERLYSREDEFGEMVRFCAGDEPYLWWQAGPWAGKSALLASFATARLGGVDVVSFFITSRVSGEADSDAFLMAMIEQLRALTGLTGDALATAGGRRGQFLDLLRVAGEQSERSGRRVVVVVDGLDEDAGLDPAAGRRPIIALLPRQPPPGVRFVVASRPHRSLLEHVRADHPLARLEPLHLSASPHAEDIEVAARDELWQILSGGPAQRDLIGIITASGGGLTLKNLEQLTGQLSFELEMMISGLSGRSLRDRYGSADIHPDRPRVFLFAHETLRELAEQQLGAGLPAYRDRIHQWAEAFEAGGWPADTPGYLFRGYPRLLSALGDLSRLTACALDTARHDRMQNLTGGDYLALSEVTAAQELNLAGDPDLDRAVRLSMRWDDLTRRSSTLPLNLPAVWAAAGEPVRAENLARGLIGPERQATALLLVAENLRSRAAADRLLTLVWNLSEDITSRTDRLRAQESVVRALAYGGDPRRAERLALTLDDESQEALLCTVAFVLAQDGDRQAAEELVTKLRQPYFRAQALASVGLAAAYAGEVDEAHSWWRAAEEAASSVTWSSGDDMVRVMVAELIARSGDLERAVVAARRITSPTQRVDALTAIAGYGQDSATSDLLLAEAESVARGLAGDSGYSGSLSTIAIAAAAVDDDERVSRLITELAGQANDTALSEALVGIGLLWRTDDIVRCGLVREHAERVAGMVAEGIGSGAWWPGQAKPLVLAAQALVAIGDFDLATGFVTALPDPERKIQALTDLAESMLEAGAPDRARDLLTQAEALASTPAEGRRGDWIAVRLVAGLAAIGDWDRAETVAGDIYDPQKRAEAWRSLAARAAAVGDFDRAEAAIPRIAAGSEQAVAIGEVAELMAQSGHPGRALALLFPDVAAITDDPPDSGSELAMLATVLAGAGRPNEATVLARRIVDPEFRVRTLTEVIQRLGADHYEIARDLLGEAERMARRLPRGQLLGRLARSAAAIGDHDRADALFLEAEDQIRREPNTEYHRVTEMAWLAQSMVAAGEVERARTLIAAAERISSTLERGYPGEQFLSFSSGLAGDFDYAEKLADGLVDQDNRAWALGELAMQLTQAGQYARADEVAGKTVGSSRSAETLAALALLALQTEPGLDPASESRRWACRFAARALAAGPWFLTSEALAVLDRDAFYAALDR